MTPAWDYEVATDTQDVQRRVMERLFRKETPRPAMVDRSEDIALLAAAQEVRDIARTFGKAEGRHAGRPAPGYGTALPQGDPPAGDGGQIRRHSTTGGRTGGSGHRPHIRQGRRGFRRQVVDASDG